MPTWLTIVISVISCLLTGGLLGFIQFMIQRHDKKHGLLNTIIERLDSVDEKQIKSEKDALRTQLLMMISNYPHEHREILMLAQRYFFDLKGNWFCSTLFENYLKQEHIKIPKWFNASTTYTDPKVGKE